MATYNSCCGPKPLVLTESTFRSNCLGFPQAPRCKPELPKCVKTTCVDFSCDGQTAWPHAYEAGIVPGFVAFPTDGLAGFPVATMRTIRASNGYAIGSAVQASTGETVGYCVKLFDKNTTVPLVQTFDNGDVYAMPKPRQLLVEPDGTVIIVGDGTYLGITYPAIAFVSKYDNNAHIIMGNGSESSYDRYYDVLRYPCDPCALYVCGTTRVDDVDKAAVFVVNRYTGAANEVQDITTVSGASVAVSMTLVDNRMLVLGVQVGASGSSLLWAVAAKPLAEIIPWTTTSFNDPVTHRLRLPLNASLIKVIRVFSTCGGDVFAVANGTFDTAASPGFPAQAVVVYRFNADTQPEIPYATSGIAIWFNPNAVASFATDGDMTPDGTVYVTGNAYSSIGLVTGYVNPELPFLSVQVASATDPAPPQPFLAVVRPDGCTLTLVRELDGCAEANFANALFVLPGIATVVGDVVLHLGCPGQSAGLLYVEVSLRSCPPRVGNNGRVAVPFIRSDACDTPTVADNVCAPTVFQVAGPIIVGCANSITEAVPVAGTIAFDPATRQFQGYDGVSWKTFTLT